MDLCSPSAGDRNDVDGRLYGDTKEIFQDIAGSLTIYHFGNTLPDSSVQIDPGVSDVVKGLCLQSEQGIINTDLSRSNLLKYFSCLTHAATSAAGFSACRLLKEASNESEKPAHLIS